MKKVYEINKVSDLRKRFWLEHPQFSHEYKRNKRQNEYSTDIACAWVDFVDNCFRNEIISYDMCYNKATL